MVDRTRKTVNKQVGCGVDFDDYSLQNILDAVTRAIKEYGPNATHSSYHEYDGELYHGIFKDVPETDEEMAKRITAEEKWEAAQDALDLKELKRLQKKFKVKS